MSDDDQDLLLCSDNSFPEVVNPPKFYASESDLGLRLKTLRELYGMSQRELAKRAAVTNSNISMIEQGQVSPSVQSLGRILGAFPMSLQEFFAWDFYTQPDETDLIVRAQELRWRKLGSLGCADLSMPDSAQQLKLQQWVLAPATATQFTRPLAGVDIAGQLLEGELQLMLAAHIYKLSAGDSFYIRANQTYRFVNPLKQEARLICCSLFGTASE